VLFDRWLVVAYPTDLSDNQWAVLEPLLCLASKRGPKHGGDLRHVVEAMLYVTHGVSVAVPAWRVRSVDEGVVTVPAVVCERDMDASVGCRARTSPCHVRAGGAAAVDGGDRHASRPWRVSWRVDVP
jgi:hypothetical protein